MTRVLSLMAAMILCFLPFGKEHQRAWGESLQFKAERIPGTLNFAANVYSGDRLVDSHFTNQSGRRFETPYEARSYLKEVVAKKYVNGVPASRGNVNGPSTAPGKPPIVTYNPNLPPAAARVPNPDLTGTRPLPGRVVGKAPISEAGPGRVGDFPRTGGGGGPKGPIIGPKTHSH